MISATILTTRGTTFPIDVLTDGEPDQLGAARIVPGHVRNHVRAIIVGQEDMYEGCIGPMASVSTLTSPDPRFEREVARVLGVTPPPCFKAVVDLHDRYETPAQYDILSR